MTLNGELLLPLSSTITGLPQSRLHAKPWPGLLRWRRRVGGIAGHWRLVFNTLLYPLCLLHHETPGDDEDVLHLLADFGPWRDHAAYLGARSLPQPNHVDCRCEELWLVLVYRFAPLGLCIHLFSRMGDSLDLQISFGVGLGHRIRPSRACTSTCLGHAGNPTLLAPLCYLARIVSVQ